ncbi:MAG: glycosyltransferase family 4 protein [Fluviicola sp.]
MSKHGATVSIITLQYPFVREPYQWNNISVYPLNGANKKVNQLFLAKKAIQHAKKVHEKKPVDVVHAFWLNRATEIAQKIAIALNVPLLATAMGQEMRNPNRRLPRWRNASFPIVSISGFQSDALRNVGIRPKSIIPWGVEGVVASKKDVDLICVGSLIPLKNVAYFLELCAELKSHSNDFRAIVLGDGPERKHLEIQIQDYNLKPNVQLLGSLSYKETQQWIARSKVLVHASSFEGFGMVIIEALANETLVLATPVGIAKELEIPHLIGDPKLDVAMLQMLLRANRPDKQLFPIEETVTAYINLYESVSTGMANVS